MKKLLSIIEDTLVLAIIVAVIVVSIKLVVGYMSNDSYTLTPNCETTKSYK